MSTTRLLPLTDLSKVELIDKETGNVKIKYLQGIPRQYRFDASKGFFNMKGDERLTKNGDPFTIIPLAFQIFTDEILGDQYGRMRWVELIFLNNALQVCSLLLHGYSVQNLTAKAGDLFYDNANFCQVKLTIKPVEKTSTDPQANGAKYWMAFFDYVLIEKEELEKLETATKGLEFYRADTYTANREIELSQNYAIPREIQRLQQAQEQEAEQIGDTKKKSVATESVTETGPAPEPVAETKPPAKKKAKAAA